MIKKKLVVIDYLFKNFQGHHFNYNLEIYKRYKKNFELKFYVHKNIDDKIKRIFNGKIVNYFDYDYKKKNYLSYFISNLKKILPKKILLNKELLSFKSYKVILLIINFFFKRKIIKNELIINFKKILKLYSDSNFLFHTIDTKTFVELCIELNQFYTNNKIIIVYRRDPRELENSFNIVKRLIDQKKIVLLTDSKKIKNFFKEKKINTQLINIPIIIKKKNFFNPKKKFKLGYLGDARHEKGFFNLPKLVKKIDTNKYPLLIQSNSNGYDLNNYRTAMRKLKKINNVHFVNESLSEEKYKNIFKSLDLIIIPYIQDYYLYRTSGIFFESIYSEIPAIVTQNTWMSSFYKNKILKRLILSEKNEINTILIFISENFLEIAREIKKLKSKIMKFNNYSQLDKVLLKKKQSK